jgi:hypothetical protein
MGTRRTHEGRGHGAASAPILIHEVFAVSSKSVEAAGTCRGEPTTVEDDRLRSTASKIGLKATAITLLSFLPSFTALRHLQPNGIVLYQGIALGVFLCSAQFLWERRRGLYFPEAAKDALLAFLLAYCFLFTVPTTVDRAYSVKMLMAIGQSSDGLTREQINDLFVHELVEQGGVDKRLIEQTSTGSIRFHDGRYTVTRLGRLLNVSFRTARRLFACTGNNNNRQITASQNRDRPGMRGTQTGSNPR